MFLVKAVFSLVLILTNNLKITFARYQILNFFQTVKISLTIETDHYQT